jgi:hypothetical protein
MIRLGDLEKKEREITVMFQGEELNVTYRPNAVTPAFIDSLKGLPPRESNVKQLIGIVKRWDLVDEDKNMLALDEESVRLVPMLFLEAVLEGITDDLRSPGKEEKKG